MPTLTYTYGLPASGKTTFAREAVAKDHSIVRANLDDIRLLLHGPQTKFNKNREKAAVLVQNAMITAALNNGRDVICDDTNLNPTAWQRLHALAGSLHEVVRKDFSDVPLGECIRRDAARGQAGNRSVGEDVIRGMYDRWLKPPTLPGNEKPHVVVFDIDGTLAHMNGNRSPYEWDKVGEDLPSKMVVNFAKHCGYPVVVMSGRDGICRPQTEAWLAAHGIDYVQFYMRPVGDMRPDWIIKNELLDQLLENWYPVLAVDDRQQVVDNVWRARGIECWQVAPGRF